MSFGEQEDPFSVKAGEGGQTGDRLALSWTVGRAFSRAASPWPPSAPPPSTLYIYLNLPRVTVATSNDSLSTAPIPQNKGLISADFWNLSLSGASSGKAPQIRESPVITCSQNSLYVFEALTDLVIMSSDRPIRQWLVCVCVYVCM